jgi:hypothetical protein
VNPWAFILLIVAVVIGVSAAKGKQDNLVAAIKGSAYGNSTLK